MTVKNWSKHYNAVHFIHSLNLGISFFFLASCASAHISKVTHPSALSGNLEQVQKLDVSQELQRPEYSLSSNQVMVGTLVAIRIKVPLKYTHQTIVGKFDEITLPFYPCSEEEHQTQDFEALLGVPYIRDPGPGKVFVYWNADDQSPGLEIPLNIIPGNYRSETLRVDGRRVNPTRKKDLNRIIQEQKEIGEIYRQVTPKKYWSGPFVLPIQSAITSPFGSRRVYNGKLKNFHPGLDLRAAIGTPIYSAAPGKVVLAKELFYTGNTVMVDHGYGVITLYAHMNQIKVKKGDPIKVGQLLGLSGKTGRVSGPHLHWQAVVHQVKVNPLGLTTLNP